MAGELMALTDPKGNRAELSAWGPGREQNAGPGVDTGAL